MASTVWRGYITFGLISIPVRLFRAARAERVSLRKVSRAGRDAEIAAADADADADEVEPEPGSQHRGRLQPEPDERTVSQTRSVEPEETYRPVQQVSVVKGAGNLLPQASVVKGYEYERNRFVSVEPEELKSIAAKTSTEMEILEFVSLADIDPVYFETSYYVRPEESGERAYALLFRALQTTTLVALGQFAMHGREHLFVLRPGKRGVIAHTLYYSSEVRAPEEYRADTDAIKPNELKLSEQLIHSLTSPFEPEKFKDSYREKLEAIIGAKIEGRSVPATPVEASRKPVVDITEALKRSLAQIKKPSARESGPARKAAKTAGHR